MYLVSDRGPEEAVGDVEEEEEGAEHAVHQTGHQYTLDRGQSVSRLLHSLTFRREKQQRKCVSVGQDMVGC